MDSGDCGQMDSLHMLEPYKNNEQHIFNYEHIVKKKKTQRKQYKRFEKTMRNNENPAFRKAGSQQKSMFQLSGRLETRWKTEQQIKLVSGIPLLLLEGFWQKWPFPAETLLRNQEMTPLRESHFSNAYVLNGGLYFQPQHFPSLRIFGEFLELHNFREVVISREGLS